MSRKGFLRWRFRRDVFKRDGHRCVVCAVGRLPFMRSAILDAHHITSRDLMPAGGYVKENGITLCAACHEKAEAYIHGAETAGFAPADLYLLVGSSYEAALRASERLARARGG